MDDLPSGETVAEWGWDSGRCGGARCCRARRRPSRSGPVVHIELVLRGVAVRSRHVHVLDEVELRPALAVRGESGVLPPVVDDVVADVGDPRVGRLRVAVVVVGEQVVVEADAFGLVAAEVGTLGVLAFGVRGVPQAFGDDVPREGDVAGVGVERDVLVDRPGDRAVIDDDVVGALLVDHDAIGGVVTAGAGMGAGTEPHEADHHVVRVDAQHPLGVARVRPQGDAAARGGLPGDGEEGLLDVDVGLEHDRPRDPEDHDACARAV